jgi:hypothetical protein
VVFPPLRGARGGVPFSICFYHYLLISVFSGLTEKKQGNIDICSWEVMFKFFYSNFLEFNDLWFLVYFYAMRQ